MLPQSPQLCKNVSLSVFSLIRATEKGRMMRGGKASHVAFGKKLSGEKGV
jgi:hypothetical protein